MKRGVIDILRRGLDNALANWPLILIRLGETLLFGLIAVVAAIAILVPVLVSVGIEIANISTPEQINDALFILMNRWMILVWIFVAVSVLLLVFVALHSFVEAGSARVLVDGERIAGPAMEGLRSRYKVFSMDRWMAGGVDGWWTLFLIYNIAWGAAGLILLIPLLPTAILMIVFRERPPALIATGCIGLLLTGLLLIGVGIVTGIWTNRAIAGWAVRRSGARDALAEGWKAFRDDLARHLLVALAVIVVAMAGSAFFASFSFFAALGETVGRSSQVFNVFTLPLRIAGSIFSSAFSAAVSSWYIASFCAIAVERER